MRVRVYYTSVNCGDGSHHVEFFESQECISFLEEHDPESYSEGEGGGSFEVVEDGGHLDLSEILPGLPISTLEQVKKRCGSN